MKTDLIVSLGPDAQGELIERLLPESFPRHVIQLAGTGEIEHEIAVDADVATATDHSGRTQTLKRTHLIQTGGAISTRLGKALVDVILADIAIISGGTLATERTDQILASGAVLTRFRKAFVHRLLAQLPCPARTTSARIIEPLIDTTGSVLTRIAQTFIHLQIKRSTIKISIKRKKKLLFDGYLQFAVDSGDSIGAEAGVAEDLIGAGSAVEARIGETLVDVNVTVVTGESRRTQTREIVDAIHTRCGIETGRRVAFVDVVLALHSGISRLAAAHVAEFEHFADGAVVARQRETVVDLQQEGLFELFRLFGLCRFSEQRRLQALGFAGRSAAFGGQLARAADAEFLAAQRLVVALVSPTTNTSISR